MKIVIASDHGGYQYKQILLDFIQQQGYAVTDLGAFTEVASNYPDDARDVALAIQQQQATKGILVCGSGAGVSVAANKFKGIRAAVCHDHYTAHQCVEHDDVNVLCMGQRVIGIESAKEIVRAFLSASFSNEEKHRRRLDKVKACDKNE